MRLPDWCRQATLEAGLDPARGMLWRLDWFQRVGRLVPHLWRAEGFLLSSRILGRLGILLVPPFARIHRLPRLRPVMMTAVMGLVFGPSLRRRLLVPLQLVEGGVAPERWCRWPVSPTSTLCWWCSHFSRLVNAGCARRQDGLAQGVPLSSLLWCGGFVALSLHGSAALLRSTRSSRSWTSCSPSGPWLVACLRGPHSRHPAPLPPLTSKGVCLRKRLQILTPLSSFRPSPLLASWSLACWKLLAARLELL